MKRPEADASCYVPMNLSNILLFRAGREFALTIQAQAIAAQQIYTEPTALD